MTRQELLDALTAERFAPPVPRPSRALVPLTPAAGRRHLRALAEATKPAPRRGGRRA